MSRCAETFFERMSRRRALCRRSGQERAMFKWLIRNRLAAFERSFDYDMSYARSILAADTRAFLVVSKLMGFSRYRRDVPVDAYYAVKLVGTLAEDCGPCTQLVVALALREG